MANQSRWRRLIRAVILASAYLALSGPGLAQDDVNGAFARATQLHESGDIQGAIRGYQAILAAHPQRGDVRSNLGAAYSRLGRYEEAIEQYKQALALDSHNEAIRFNLALAYYKAAWFAEAASQLSQFLAAAPKSLPQRANAIRLLAECEVRLGEYKKVIALLSPIAESDASDRTVAYLLGSALIGDGQAEKGQVIIDRVFREENSAEARLLMGSILLLADDGHGAIKEFERGLELNPKLPTLRAWYGRALMRMGDGEKAKTVFKGELTDNPNDFEANLYLGVLLRQDKLFEEAFTYLSRALQLRPRDQQAYYHLAAVYVARGLPNEARPLLESVVREHPDFIEAHVLLASVYYRLNRNADGKREQEVIQKLTAEQQTKQPGSQDTDKSDPVKPPANPPSEQIHQTKG